MSLSSTTILASELGNGVKTAFQFAFKIFSTTDLLVYKETSAGVFTPQTIVADWSGDPLAEPAANTCYVTFDTDAQTGEVVYSEAPANGLASVVLRDTAETQETTFPPLATWSKKAVENALDKLTMIAQEVNERLGRAAVQPSLPANPVAIEISAPVEAKGLKWQLTGGKWYIVSTTEDAEDMVDLAAASASAALISQNAAAASALAAQGSATAAGNSAIAAAASALASTEIFSGLRSAKPLAPATNMWWWSTDAEQLERYVVVAGKWFLIG